MDYVQVIFKDTYYTASTTAVQELLGDKWKEKLQSLRCYNCNPNYTGIVTPSDCNYYDYHISMLCKLATVWKEHKNTKCEGNCVISINLNRK